MQAPLFFEAGSTASVHLPTFTAAGGVDRLGSGPQVEHDRSLEPGDHEVEALLQVGLLTQASEAVVHDPLVTRLHSHH